MNQAVKHLFTFAFALVFMAGTAFAQNTATESQTGNNNESLVEQSQVNGAESSLTQVGNENKSIITQVGNDQIVPPSMFKATVSSEGNRNRAVITQGGDADSESFESEIMQVGNDNRAETSLQRTPQSAKSFQTQDGNRNRAFVNVNAGLGSGDNGSIFTQTQIGNDNRAESAGTGASQSTQYQEGNFNNALIKGVSKGGPMKTQEQIGNRNDARFEGSNYGFGPVDQLQYGNDNRSFINDLSHVGPGESTYTLQDGNDNLARVNANGYGGAQIDIQQFNNDNVAKVDYTQDGNVTTIMQNGNENESIVNQ